MKNLNFARLEKLMVAVPIPPSQFPNSQFHFNLTPFTLSKLPEQKSIVKKLDALSVETKKLEAIYTQKLADLEELRKSVLKKAFSGKL